MAALVVPPEIEAVFREVRTCELTTLAKDGTPITWPTVALYQRAEARFVITTSIGLPQKAHNLRRTPRVAMLYSDPTGSGLAAPPAVLVQGDAACPDQIVTRSDELDALGRLIMVRQPVSARYSANPLARWLSDWYLMRLLIYITPRRIRWWPHSDFSRPAAELEVDHVG
jgi:Pyridoxamine 5'-phosphate oxidase